jgi:hypothetical protein
MSPAPCRCAAGEFCRSLTIVFVEKKTIEHIDRDAPRA